jgi:hypothetical protein
MAAAKFIISMIDGASMVRKSGLFSSRAKPHELRSTSG